MKTDMDKTMLEALNSAFKGTRIKPRALQRGVRDHRLPL
jgi:hypothetical protein